MRLTEAVRVTDTHDNNARNINVDRWIQNNVNDNNSENEDDKRKIMNGEFVLLSGSSSIFTYLTPFHSRMVRANLK